MNKVILALVLMTACTSSMNVARTATPPVRNPAAEQQALATQRELRSRFHGAFDDSRVLLVDAMTEEDYCHLNINWNLLVDERAREAGIPQLGGSCAFSCGARTVCAIVVPRGYNTAYLYLPTPRAEDRQTVANMRFRIRIPGQAPYTRDPVEAQGEYRLSEIIIND